MNAVTIVGRLTRDPELTERGDRKVCDLRIAESSGREQDTPLYIDVATFGPQAETCAQYLRKGRLVAVEGRLRYSEWSSSEDGSKRSRHSVVARRVEFLDAKREDEPAEAREDAGVAA